MPSNLLLKCKCKNIVGLPVVDEKLAKMFHYMFKLQVNKHAPDPVDIDACKMFYELNRKKRKSKIKT